MVARAAPKVGGACAVPWPEEDGIVVGVGVAVGVGEAVGALQPRAEAHTHNKRTQSTAIDTQMRAGMVVAQSSHTGAVTVASASKAKTAKAS